MAFELDFFGSGPRYSSSVLEHLVTTLVRSFYGTFERVFTVVLHGQEYYKLGFPKISFSSDASCRAFPQHVDGRLVQESELFFF